MHGRFDRSNDTTGKSLYRSFGIGIFVLPVVLVALLVGLALTRPNLSAWISEAEQAELVSSGQATGSVPEQAAPPAREARVDKAD